MADIKQEIAEAIEFSTTPVAFTPNKRLRHKILGFVIENGLDKVKVDTWGGAEGAAVAVLLNRYFQMAESDKWASWFSERGEQP